MVFIVIGPRFIAVCSRTNPAVSETRKGGAPMCSTVLPCTAVLTCRVRECDDLSHGSAFQSVERGALNSSSNDNAENRLAHRRILVVRERKALLTELKLL